MSRFSGSLLAHVHTSCSTDHCKPSPRSSIAQCPSVTMNLKMADAPHAVRVGLTTKVEVAAEECQGPRWKRRRRRSAAPTTRHVPTHVSKPAPAVGPHAFTECWLHNVVAAFASGAVACMAERNALQGMGYRGHTSHSLPVRDACVRSVRKACCASKCCTTGVSQCPLRPALCRVWLMMRFAWDVE